MNYNWAVKGVAVYWGSLCFALVTRDRSSLQVRDKSSGRLLLLGNWRRWVKNVVVCTCFMLLLAGNEIWLNQSGHIGNLLHAIVVRSVVWSWPVVFNCFGDNKRSSDHALQCYDTSWQYNNFFTLAADPPPLFSVVWGSFSSGRSLLSSFEFTLGGGGFK